MLIWLLVNHKSMKYKIDAFVGTGRAAGHTIELVGPEDFVLGAQGSQPLIARGGKRARLPDAVISIAAMHLSKDQLEGEIILALENSGVHVLNTYAAREVANDKFRTLQALAKYSLPFPKTILFDPDQCAIESLFKSDIFDFSYPVIFKPVDSSQGIGVTLCNSERELQSVLSLVQVSAKPSSTFIIQEFIGSSKGRDVRVMILGGQVLGAMLRTGAPESITANFSSGGSVAPYELDEQSVQLALAAARATGLEYAGVDLLFGENGFVVCEVNANPGFSGFAEATGIDVPRKIFEYLSK